MNTDSAIFKKLVNRKV